MFLHVRKTYDQLDKADSLMLHVEPDVGSTSKFRPLLADGAQPGDYLITSTRVTADGHDKCNLHVRKTWAEQLEENTLMLCHHGEGNAGSQWTRGTARQSPAAQFTLGALPRGEVKLGQ